MGSGCPAGWDRGGVILVGTSGWQYSSWRGRFYPAGLPQRLWLEFYAQRFVTVEVNNAFYRLPQRTTFEAWRQRTPADFVAGVKMSRYLTHVKRLQDPADPVAHFLDRAGALGDKLGPVLLQLPPTLGVDLARLDATLAELAPRVRVAVEPRHPSWWTPSVRRVLSDHGAALCWADRQGQPVTPLWRTAPFGYLRFHEGGVAGGGGDPGDGASTALYARSSLDAWLERITTTYPISDDIFVYFNNDAGAAAVTDAAVFGERARRCGLPTTRLPTDQDVNRAKQNR
jgi:uncharacterized protein YecE (DUF72 family)